MGVGFSTLESMSRIDSYTRLEWSDMVSLLREFQGQYPDAAGAPPGFRPGPAHPDDLRVLPGGRAPPPGIPVADGPPRPPAPVAARRPAPRRGLRGETPVDPALLRHHRRMGGRVERPAHHLGRP